MLIVDEGDFARWSCRAQWAVSGSHHTGCERHAGDTDRARGRHARCRPAPGNVMDAVGGEVRSNHSQDRLNEVHQQEQSDEALQATHSPAYSNRHVSCGPESEIVE